MGYSRLFLILLIFLVSCNQESKYASKMPEKMPEDFNFSIKFGYMSKNEINSFTSTVTKDLISKGVIKTSSKLSEDERQRIYRQMFEMNIMTDLKLEPKSGCYQMPFTEDSWEIQLNGLITTYNWSSEQCKITEDAEKLQTLREFVFNIIKDKAEYKKLPPAVGGYQ